MHVSWISADRAATGQPSYCTGCRLSPRLAVPTPGSVARMLWTEDVTPGEWLRERIDDPWRGTMHDVVPRGFPAYVRIFHPASRDRPVGAEWPREPYSNQRAWEKFQKAHPDLELIDEHVTWAAAAAAFGTVMHPCAQWSSIVSVDPHGNREDDPRDTAGWRYQDPEQGGMPAEQVAAIAEVLAQQTTTPDAGFVALWEGTGGLLGHIGEGPSRAFFQMGDPESAELARHNTVLGSSFKDRLNNVFRKATWQEGILSRDISDGARLSLPGRDYVLFRGGVSELADPDWVLDIPWRDRVAEEHGFPPDAHAPSIVWPDDHAWVTVTEVDFDSTIVGCSAEAADALCADPRLEAMVIPEGADLSWDADEVNR